MSSEKTLPATQKKLQDARRKGQIPKSAQVVSTCVFGGVLGCLLLTYSFMLSRISDYFDAALAAMQKPGIDTLFAFVQGSISAFLVMVMPVLACAFVFAIAGGFLQTKGLVAFDVISIKPEKLNPVTNLKQILSLKQTLDLAKKIVEASVLAIIAFLVGWNMLPRLLRGAYDTPMATAETGLTMIALLCGLCALFWVLVSAIDYAIQRFTFMRDQRMSFDEVRRDHKETDGDPMVKGMRRALHREVNESQQGGSLKNAKALVVNPTHVAVALGYDGGARDVPRVVAKAVDLQALALRTEAQALGIPIFQDIPLARGLFAAVGLGAPITSEFFEPVAEVFLWLERLADDADGAPDDASAG